MKTLQQYLCAAALLFAAEGAAKADMVAELKLQSQPGDFIGLGQTVDNIYTPQNSTFFWASAGSLIGGQPSSVSFTLGTVTGSNLTNTFTTIDFNTTQLGITLQPGTYGLPGNTAERAAFATAGHPGMDVTFQNRGSNTLTGNFTISSVSFFLDGNNTLQIGEFHVTFEEHSEGGVPAVFGSFDYHAAAIPEPSSIVLAGFAASIPVGSWLRRRRAAPVISRDRRY